ncbi:MAG: spore maturation protein A [Oscillospiraceae bacterium]|nr:spore maturation protein A [Oscillospiraceae bacterium]
MLGVIWTVLLAVSVVFGIATGRVGFLSAAVSEGAQAAVTTVLSITGMMMLWCAVMEVMRESGLAEKLARLLSPLLKRLFPSANSDTLSHLSANVSANLLGLGNAATPAGIRAAEGLRNSPSDLTMLTVINTSSLQLIPTTVAAIRASAGATAPFDILPAVWLATLAAQVAGILAVRMFHKGGKPCRNSSSR